ncbi:MAG TPA: hypothetical protein DEF04_01420 [Clostridiales bacterium]|nr:hypothetical protein [Clostridiales bacterium]
MLAANYAEIAEAATIQNGQPLLSNIYSFGFGENIGHIEVNNGAVRMLEMDEEICPEGICSKTGRIKEAYETIVCMPNGITANIKSNVKGIEKNKDIDVIT